MKLPTNRGYTLLEAIIYIVILAVMSVIFISLLFTMTESFNEFRLTRALVSSASAGLERLVRETQHAATIDLASNLGVHPGRLLLNTTNATGLPTTLDFYLLAGALMVKEGTATAVPITATGVTVDGLIFRQIVTAESTAVKMELTLSAHRGALTRAEKFYATAVLRDSY